jgi:4-hydroxybenzoate polyprenyltransferase
VILSPHVLRRLGVYFLEMFPPWVMLPMSAVHFLSIELGLQALAGRSPLRLSWRSVVGSVAIVLFSLLLRVQDELKDHETDIRLARSGDPRYTQRPLVTGRVLPSDLVYLRYLALGGAIGASAALGHEALVACGGLLVVIVASLYWFFYPRMSKNLILAFATHNPIGALVSCWAIAACVPETGRPTAWAGLLVLGLWLPVAAWEIARKVRLPQDETDYTTYSKILGWKTAGILPAVLIALSAGTLGAFAMQAGAHVGYYALLGVAALVPIACCLAFVLAPTSGRANLRPATELYGAVAGAGLIAALALRHGVVA